MVNKDGLLTVANTKLDDTLASSSSRGAFVDLAAPGESVLSTDLAGGFGTNQSGTSFSAPFVSGAAAVLLSRKVPIGQVKQRMKRTSLPVTGIDPDGGRIDLFQMLFPSALDKVVVTTVDVPFDIDVLVEDAFSGGGSEAVIEIEGMSVTSPATVMLVSGAEVALSGTTLTYTPPPGSTGLDSFTYTVEEANPNNTDEKAQDSATVNVVVSEAANNAPVFDQVSLSFEIPLASAVGTTVTTVSATDDPGEVLTFSILSGNSSGQFAVDSASGEITVADNSQFSDIFPLIVLTLQVEDEGFLSDTMTVRIDVNSAPVLESFSFTPTSIDTSSGDQTITLTGRVTDDLAGLSSVQVTFRGPGGDQSVNAFFSSSNRISGDALDGTYETAMTVPQFSESGTWELNFVFLRDLATNSEFVGTADLIAQGFPTTFEQTGSDDTTPPTLASLSFTPTSVDTSGGDQTITMTGRITDDLAGVVSAQLTFRSPSGGQSVNAFFSSFNRTSGDELDGTYETDMTPPQFSESGTWELNFFFGRDSANNSSFVSTAELIAQGLPTTFQQTGAGDTTPPTLVSFSLTPTELPISGSPQTITVTARITDDLAGVGNFSNQLTFRSTSQQQSVNVFFSQFNRISGDALDGTYESNMTIPGFCRTGDLGSQFLFWSRLGKQQLVYFRR